MSEPGQKNGDPPQLQIWDTATRVYEPGALPDHEATWSLIVVAERSSADLCRGRISFRRGEERYDTDAILLEESEDDLVRRASELPASTLRQFLSALISD